jgi:hypothetical protein
MNIETLTGLREFHTGAYVVHKSDRQTLIRYITPPDESFDKMLCLQRSGPASSTLLLGTTRHLDRSALCASLALGHTQKERTCVKC